MLRRDITDAEYERLLKETYPQIDERIWIKFMALVKKASFSKEEISAKEADFCKSLYDRSNLKFQ